MNRFQLWHDQLWQLRKDIGHDRYPIPEPEDALAFAVTEAAEALDAWLMQKGGWVRNNPDAKHTDEYREWAQCACMLMLVLGEGWEYEKYSYLLSEVNLARPELVSEVARYYSMNSRRLDETGQGVHIQWLIESIDTYCVGLDMHMQQEFQRLRDKWLPEGGEA